MTSSTAEHIALTLQYSAHNYSPLEVVIAEGDGVWVKDVEGKRYLDMLAAYSALNFGHCNKEIAQAAHNQIDKLTLTSRAFYHDQFGPFCNELAELCGMEKVLLMNTGSEAVETAVKMARKWGYEIKGIEKDKAEIICFQGNFHGRTTTIVSFSDSPSSYQGYGPFTPGFKIIPYGDVPALENAVTKNTAGVLFEPIQGEGGVIVPPDGYIKAIRRICTDNNVIMLADEVQTGFCRTGDLFCCDHEEVKPDAYILGKSLGGGIMPVSAVVSYSRFMDVFAPGSHGSTFGGNALACAIGREVVRILNKEDYTQIARGVGEYFGDGLRSIKSSIAREVRGRGLMFGVDIDPSYGKAKKICLKLKDLGVLSKDTRDQTIRFAPPLKIEKSDIDWGLERIEKALR